jgi:hypothetical protein
MAGVKLGWFGKLLDLSVLGSANAEPQAAPPASAVGVAVERRV